MGYRMKAIILLILFSSLTGLYGINRYALSCRNDLLAESGRIAKEQVGVIEYRRNSGKMISRYLRAVGLPEGQPYCAAGQYWCFAEACRLLSINRNEIPLPRTGLANSMFNYAKKYGKPTKPIAQIGDLIVWRRGKSIFGHIERIIAKVKAGWFYTIGFNTSKYINGKKYEGVFVQKRNIYHFLGRLRFRGFIGFNTRRQYDT